MSKHALPCGWAEACLEDVAWNSRSKAQPADHRSLPFIGMDNVEAHTMRLLGTVPASSMKSAGVLFRSGDVLYGRLRPYLNKVAAPDFDGLASAEFIPLTAPPGIEPRFVQYRVNAADFVSFASHLDGGDRPRVDYGQIAAFCVGIPPTSEQRRIVGAIESHFTRLDNAVATLEKVRRNLKRYRASVLKAAVEGRLVPTEAELARAEARDFEPASVLLDRIIEERRRRWRASDKQASLKEPSLSAAGLPSRLPEGWCWASVDQVGDVLLGRQRAPQYLTGRWPRPYLRVANIKSDRIDYSDVEAMDFDDVHYGKYRLKVGDILVSEGQSPELLGQSAIYRGGVDGLCFQKTLHRFRQIPGGPSSEFSQLVFRAHVSNGVFKRIGSITTNIAHLTLERFKSAPFPLPPAKEQVRIVEGAEPLLTIAEAQEAVCEVQVARMRRLRQSILRWAFEGKLVDQDPNEEPASLLLERIKAERAAVVPATKARRSNQRARKAS